MALFLYGAMMVGIVVYNPEFGNDRVNERF